jgi:xanthine dehydrogenase molybdenum-binding subunit
VKVVTCFDVPELPSPRQATVVDRRTSSGYCRQAAFEQPRASVRRRYRGRRGEDEIAASRALRAIKVEYEEYPVLLDPIEAAKDGANSYTTGTQQHTHAYRL